jgi:hypothetical protein
MPNEAKRLIDLASIDLGYAQLEIAYADQSSEMLERIRFHLNDLKGRLSELTQSIECVEVAKEKINVSSKRKA